MIPSPEGRVAMRREVKVRAMVLDLWDRSRRGWGFATDHLAAVFREERDLSAPEREAVAATLYGLIRHARRIEHALEAGGAAKGAPSGHARYVALRLLDGDLTPDDAAQEIPGIAWGDVAGADARAATEGDPTRRIAITHSLPDWVAGRLVAEYGGEAPALAAALNRPPPVTIRANNLRTSRDALAAALRAEGVATRPTEHALAGLGVETPGNVFQLRAFKDGLFEVQDEGSQLVAELVAPPPGGLVVDVCAGAGGKTLAVAALLGGRGRLVATDVSPRKLSELRRRARRAGASNIWPVEVPPDAWPPELYKLAGAADRVLADVPCSGLGALRRNPEARWRLAAADLARLEATQADILDRSAVLVAMGGRLVYATCSILGSENEGQVARFLAAHPDFELVRAAEIWGGERARPLTDETGTVLKLLPNRQGTDGFFAAVMRRRRRS